MSLVATFDPILSRVRIAALVPAGSTVKVDVQHSLNGVRWTTVRGGSSIAAVPGDTVNLDDYEFAPGVLNRYRLQRYGAFNNVIGTDPSSTITPAQTEVWLKAITRPFLNRAVEVVEHNDITLPSRGGVFPVIGRTYPIAVTDVRLSRQWEMTVKAESVSDADALELVFMSGEPLFVQVPPSAPDIPGGYVTVGDVTRRRFGHVSQRRWFDLPLTAVAAPGPDVVGSTVTWEALIAEFGTWADVLAAFGTWADVLEYVADPEVVIVP